MAQEKDKDKTDGFGTGGSESSDFGALTGGDSGLGNLPPLSDFESSAGGGFDSGLPPLSAIDPSSDKDRISIGGLPPISDIPVETPVPTGGAVKPGASVGYGSTPVFGTPTSDGGLDTPSGSGFQDLSADSDFTPETPEVAPPGPESDIDTPLFDSAFGGGSAAFSAANTSAPTQAMATPMFGADTGGFDADAFAPGTSSRGFEGGTPIPDFGPDTAAPTTMTPPPTGQVPVGPPVKKGGKGGLLVAAIALIVGLVGGAFIGPRVSMLNPSTQELASAQNEIATLKRTIESMRGAQGGTQTQYNQEELDRLIEDINARKTELDSLTQQLTSTSTDLEAKQQELSAINSEIDQKNTEFANAQAALDTTLNQTAITQARRDGLAAEVERLENLVGKLDDADARRMLTKETLESNVEQLLILAREGSPLTPEKYSRDSRVARIQALKDRVTASNWVSPDLLDEYTSLMQQELQIAKSREYFFARLPVVDRFGTRSMAWAECVMNGNWGVYYRTLDGQHIGVYQNTASDGPPQYNFLDFKDAMVAKQVEAEIFASRPPGYEEKLELLAQKQLITDDRSELQKKFDSL
ncbi:MAG: hypothetical protein AMXMBFR4_06540 [Candidatus Hydrogenedentota bacterium]